MAPDARLLGGHRLSVWGFDVYDARLFVTPAFRPAEFAKSPIALEMRYLRNFDGSDLVKSSIDEIRRANPIPNAEADRWRAALETALPDVKKGDRLVGINLPGEGMRMLHNGTETATVRDPKLAERFFAIWLGPKSSEPELRDALLGKSGAR